MQRTADFHDQVANTRLPQTVGVVDDATALDTAVDVLDAPFGPIMATRGEADTGTAAVGRSAGGGDPSVGSTMAAAAASATPRRVANSVKDRVGASPSVRSVACSTTKRA
jgi:hypothetical protein